MSTAAPQKFEFQAEIKQLLDIVIHSLYTEKEIFVRELVSNASDALEKLRHLQITEKDIFDDTLPLEINVTTDDKAKTLTIQDFGVGMTRDELVENLGTIAHSGSKAFLKALGEGGQKNANLIGQFGVGFYSAFMVAKSVKVYTHSWKAQEPGHVWTSDGGGSYAIEEADGQRRGAKIVIELKDDCSEFSQEFRIKEILERYSAFVSFPINLNGKRINTVQALWLRIEERDQGRGVHEFYKFQAHAYDEPRLRLHFSADAPLAINALLFVPKDNTEKLGMARLEPAVSLYCRKVLIDAKPKDFLPEWLRFLKGVVDSEDLPLNISRETMQDRALIEKLNKVITKRFLKFLEDEAKNRPEAYTAFYKEFGMFLKEGAALDFTHKEALVKLLRFESSLTEKGKTTSLADYVTRMGADQKEIYYLVGPNRESIESRPVSRGLQGPKPRGPLLLRARRRVRDEQRPRVRRQEAHRRRPRRREALRPAEAGGCFDRRGDEGPGELAENRARRPRQRRQSQRPSRRLPRPRVQRGQVHVAAYAPDDEGDEQGRRGFARARQPRDQSARRRDETAIYNAHRRSGKGEAGGGADSG